MDLYKMVHGMAPQQTQAPAPQTTSDAASPNPTQPQASTAAPAGPVMAMQDAADATDAAQDPTPDHRTRKASSESLITPSTSSGAQSPSPQTLTTSPEEAPQENIPRDTKSSRPSDASVPTVLQAIVAGSSLYAELTEDEKARVWKAVANMDTDLQKNMEELGDGMSSMRLGPGSPKKRKAGNSDFIPSENDSELPTASSSKARSKIGNARGGARNSRLSASQNSNSEDKETTIDFKSFRELCGLKEEGKADPLEISIDKTVFALYTAICKADFCTKVRKYAGENSRSGKNILPDLVARGVSISNNNDRRSATKDLVQKILAYDYSEQHPPVFYEMWDNLTLVELVKPYWKDCRKEKKSNQNLAFVRWAKHDGWQKTWNSKLHDDELPKMNADATLRWYEKLKDGWYWRKWCRSLSDNESGINHRGVLLLLLGAAVSENLEDGQLVLQLKRAKTYIPENFPWIAEFAKILNPVALRMYQQRLNQQNLEELEGNLRKIKVNMAWDASPEEKTSTMDAS